MVEVAKLAYDRNIDSWLPTVSGVNLHAWLSDVAPGFEIYWGRDHAHDYPFHLHDFAEILFVHSGALTVSCRDGTVRLTAGDLCLIPPNEMHCNQTTQIGGKPSFTLFHVPASYFWSAVSRLAPEDRPSALQPVNVLTTDGLPFSLSEFMAALLDMEGDEAEGQVEMFEFLLATVLECVVRQPFFDPQGQFSHPAVARARLAIRECGEELVSVEKLANEAGLNKRYFISLFKEATGLPPRQFQIAMRVERARQLILYTSSSLSEVALMAGFADQSHLNRQFKRSYGFTPGALKNFIQII